MMATASPIHFAAQLRQHLRAFRKARKLTQSQLGHLIGVSQARIAEIEANPGLVSCEQLLKLFSALSVTITLHDDRPDQPSLAGSVDARPAARKKRTIT